MIEYHLIWMSFATQIPQTVVLLVSQDVFGVVWQQQRWVNKKFRLLNIFQLLSMFYIGYNQNRQKELIKNGEGVSYVFVKSLVSTSPLSGDISASNYYVYW